MSGKAWLAAMVAGTVSWGIVGLFAYGAWVVMLTLARLVR